MLSKRLPSHHVVNIDLLQAKVEQHVHLLVVVCLFIWLLPQLHVEVLRKEKPASDAQSYLSNNIHLALESMVWLGLR